MSVSENAIIQPVQAPREEEPTNALSNAAARLVDSLKINSVSEKLRHNRRVVTKRRNAHSGPLPVPRVIQEN
jgi:hypothetical protein